MLDLSCNRLQSVSGLEGLTALERLVLAYNSITSLAGIKAVAGPAYSLQELDLVDNLVSEIRVLHTYPSPHASTLPFLHTLSLPAYLLVSLSLPVIAHWAVCASCAEWPGWAMSKVFRDFRVTATASAGGLCTSEDPVISSEPFIQPSV